MSEPKQRCQLDGCSRAASTRCFCCNKNVCTRHFTEHIDAIKAQIDPLANDINTMVEKIQGLTIQQITESGYAQLQQWKMDMHQLIDEIFLAKTKEIEDIIEKNRAKFNEHKKQQFEIIMKVQDEVRQLAEDGDATYEQIQLLKTKLAAVETNLKSFEKDFVSVNVTVVAQGLVTISSNLNKPAVTQYPRLNWDQLEQQNVVAPTNNSHATLLSELLNPSSVASTLPRQPGLGGFTSSSASNLLQPVCTAASLFEGFGSNPTNIPSPFAAAVAAPTNPFGNNQPRPPNTLHPVFFPFNNNGQK